MKFQPETLDALANELERAINLTLTHVRQAQDMLAGNANIPGPEAVQQLNIAAISAQAAYGVANTIASDLAQPFEFGIEPEEFKVRETGDVYEIPLGVSMTD